MWNQAQVCSPSHPRGFAKCNYLCASFEELINEAGGGDWTPALDGERSFLVGALTPSSPVHKKRSDMSGASHLLPAHQ